MMELLVVLAAVSKLHRIILMQIHNLLDLLIIHAWSSRCFKEALALQLINVLSNLLHHLEFISTSFFTMCHGAQELQCIYIELTALLDFEENHCIQSPEMPAPVNCFLMGAFTHDLAICDWLYQTGILVCLICPYSTLHSIWIKSMKPLTQPMGFFPTEPSSRLTYSMIYQGQGDTLDRYLALAWSTLDYLQYPNPFGKIHANPLVNPPSLAAGPSKYEIRSQWYTPCKLYFSWFPSS